MMATTRHGLARLMALLIVISMTAVNIATASPASAATVINGVGSNFTLTAMQQWQGNFPNVNYQGIGSPAGLNQFYPPQGPEAAQPIDFVETDIPYTQGQLTTHTQYPLGPASAHGVWSYVPIAAGGISMAYHLHDSNGQPVGTLRLNQIAIADIMTFQITRWNDPYLVGLNPSIALPNEPIHLVVDSAASGQTYLLSQYFLSNPTTAPLYTHYTGDTLPQANWGPLKNTPQGPLVYPCSPQCIAENGPSAQAEYVSQSSSEGSIAYVPTAYAVSDSEPVAAVQNFAGNYTLPSHDDVTAALDSATNPNGSGVFDGFEQIDWNAPAPSAYSISTYSYMLTWLATSPTIPGLSQDEADAVAAFGEWAITIGQENAYNIGYAPISNVLIQFALKTYESIPGAPQNVTIPCIPGSEGNHCNQDPPGPCLGGGETAGNPGNCPSGTKTKPPTVLPPAPGTPGAPAGQTPSQTTPSATTPAGVTQTTTAGVGSGSTATGSSAGPTHSGSSSNAGTASATSGSAGPKAAAGATQTGVAATSGAAGYREQAVGARGFTVVGRGAQPGDASKVGQAIPVMLADVILAPHAALIALLLALTAVACLGVARTRRRVTKGRRP